MALHPSAEMMVAGADTTPDSRSVPTRRPRTRRAAMIAATTNPALPEASRARRRRPHDPRARRATIAGARVPAERRDRAAAAVWFHGGGWVTGNLDTHDQLVPPARATHVGAVVVSVDYRLAPEAKFPAAADDCLAAYEWALAHADEVGGDPARIAIGGDSAGGNLAAVVALDARDARPAAAEAAAARVPGHRLRARQRVDDRQRQGLLPRGRGRCAGSTTTTRARPADFDDPRFVAAARGRPLRPRAVRS